MRLIDALQQGDRLTENGMTTNSSSLSPVVDLFFTIGAMRGEERDRLLAVFSKAFYTDPVRSMKILFWARDVRGGAGERQVFRDIITYLAESHPYTMKKNLHLVPHFGRWDDLLVLSGGPLERDAFALIQVALTVDKNQLCGKWMPRKGPVAARLRNFLGLSPKAYRKLLVGLSSTVEQLMCANQWDGIDFSKLPSLASARYQKAFWKRAGEQYKAYIDALKRGEAKINAGAVYPYDIIKSLKLGLSEVATEQWKALPNWMEGATEKILPMVDVSGSMGASVGNNSTVTCMDVAVSLGLYISERNEGAFKDAFLTFSGTPELQVLKGDLRDRYLQLSSASWGMNTNLEAAFKLVLDQAVKHRVGQEEMPDQILILSDMQFDAAVNPNFGRFMNKEAWNPTAQQMISQMYEAAGYKMPKIVYWNIKSRHGDVPVAFDQTGTALISGFSPAIMTSVLSAEEFTPVSIMDQTIMSERYAEITVK